MSLHFKQNNWIVDNSELVMENPFPTISNDLFDEDDEAREKRREERRKRKNDKRHDKILPEKEGDPDVLLETAKKPKRQKKKTPRPDLWYDESLDDELREEALENDGRKGRRKRDEDDWSDEWDS